VPNIFFAKPGDYKKATVTIERGGKTPSAVLLPVVPVEQAQVQAKAQ
jgi:AMMECR1 domain-containing protein